MNASASAAHAAQPLLLVDHDFGGYRQLLLKTHPDGKDPARRWLRVCVQVPELLGTIDGPERESLETMVAADHPLDRVHMVHSYTMDDDGRQQREPFIRLVMGYTEVFVSFAEAEQISRLYGLHISEVE